LLTKSEGRSSKKYLPKARRNSGFHESKGATREMGWAFRASRCKYYALQRLAEEYLCLQQLCHRNREYAEDDREGEDLRNSIEGQDSEQGDGKGANIPNCDALSHRISLGSDHFLLGNVRDCLSFLEAIPEKLPLRRWRAERKCTLSSSSIMKL